MEGGGGGGGGGGDDMCVCVLEGADTTYLNVKLAGSPARKPACTNIPMLVSGPGQLLRFGA